MNRVFLAMIILLAAALTAACGSAPTRYGKGNDHELLHPEDAEEDQAEDAER